MANCSETFSPETSSYTGKENCDELDFCGILCNHAEELINMSSEALIKEATKLLYDCFRPYCSFDDIEDAKEIFENKLRESFQNNSWLNK